MRISVIGKCFAISGYRYWFGINRQSSGFGCDGIVRCYIFSAMHNLIAFSYRIISGGCVSDIRNTSGSCCL